MIGPNEYVVGVDVEKPEDQRLAEEILRVLIEAYPGHEWFVLIRGGVIQVKNMAWSDTWGMALHYRDVVHDAADRKKQLIRAAGEFLERANVIRGRRDYDQRLDQIEGVPDSHLARAKLLGA